jgi:hypothetical protein
MNDNAYEALGRTPNPRPPGMPKVTQNAPRGQLGALNGIWAYTPGRRNQGDELYPPDVYAADLLALLNEGVDQWGEGHVITQGEWEQYTIDKYREYWGPADLAIRKGWPQWKHELRAAKIGLCMAGKIVAKRKYRSTNGKRWSTSHMSLPPSEAEGENNFQG